MSAGVGRPLSAWVDTWAEHRPDAEALSFGSERWSWAGFAGQVQRWVRVLGDQYGVGAGDRVAYLGHNHPGQLFVFFACARLGAALVPLNWRLTAAELGYQLADSEPVVVVVADRFREVVGSWPTLGVQPPEPVEAPEPTEVTGPVAPTAPVEGRDGDPMLIVYTSGTTGRPKGAVLDQRALLATALNGLFAHDLTPADRVLTVLPMFHVGGLCIQTLPAVLAGAALRLHEVFDPGAWLTDVERWQPTTSLLVPATMTALQRHPAWAQTDLSSLRGIMAGSSVVPEALIRPFHERGVPVGQIYGATETGPTALVLRFEHAMDRVGSCGRAAPHCDVRLVDDVGAEVAEGRAGEVVVRGPNVLRAYWRDAEATAAAFLPGGWFRTGDIGVRDAEGWWRIVDRSKDVVISGGENIYPAELEEVLADCPEVAEAAVVGRPDPRWGEVPVAVVVPKQPGSIDEAAVRALFEGRLARFKHPAAVVFVDALPRNVMGKVQKFRLREQLATTEQLASGPITG
ncbi:MAG: class I adenylate-forming enzyme family protein [Acidimicrobiia bacterium]